MVDKDVTKLWNYEVTLSFTYFIQVMVQKRHTNQNFAHLFKKDQRIVVFIGNDV